MSDIYKLQYDGMTLAYPGWNGYVCYEKPDGYPITYLSDEHVSITGDSIYIPGSEGITLQSSYDTYYRISGYDITNGSIVDGKLVPTGPCTIKAVQKVNAFTATGTFEKGSTISARAFKDSWEGDKLLSARYAVHGAHTGSVPTSWYNSSNRWKVTSTVSAYKIQLMPKITCVCSGDNAGSYYYFTGTTLIDTTANQTQGQSRQGNGTITYQKSFTASNTGVNYAWSAHIHSWSNYKYAVIWYYPSGNTSTWSATGYLP